MTPVRLPLFLLESHKDLIFVSAYSHTKKILQVIVDFTPPHEYKKNLSIKEENVSSYIWIE